MTAWHKTLKVADFLKNKYKSFYTSFILSFLVLHQLGRTENFTLQLSYHISLCWLTDLKHWEGSSETRARARQALSQWPCSSCAPVKLALMLQWIEILSFIDYLFWLSVVCAFNKNTPPPVPSKIQGEQSKTGQRFWQSLGHYLFQLPFPSLQATESVICSGKSWE